MPISPSRLAAFDILLRVEREGAYSSELLHSERLTPLSPADRGLCMEIVMGVLRWRSRLDADIARLSFTPFRKLDLEVLTALRMGVYQIAFLARIPARAAINESVDLVKHSRKASAAPLANAVLRKVPKSSNEERAARHAAAAPAPALAAEDLAGEYAHPAWLTQRWAAHYGAQIAQQICRFDQQVPVTSIRLRAAAAEEELLAAGLELAPGALLASARRVVQGEVTRAPACAAGRVAIQDEASQLVAALVGRGTRILDCCAAPGSKTAVLADRNPQADILAIELHPHRALRMPALVRAAQVRIIAADARHLPISGSFDRVLADVPCSGSGTLARNPEIKWRLQPADLADLHRRQVDILRAALAHLAPGGRLVFATCSLEPEENEAVIEEVLAAPLAGKIRLIPATDCLAELRASGDLVWPDLAALTRGPYLRTVPGLHPCDGFFGAILERV